MTPVQLTLYPLLSQDDPDGREHLHRLDVWFARRAWRRPRRRRAAKRRRREPSSIDREPNAGPLRFVWLAWTV